LARQARDTALILGIALDRGMNLVPLQVEHAHGHGMRRPVYVGDKHGDRRHVSNGAQKKMSIGVQLFHAETHPKTHRLAGLAMRKRPSPDFVGYWILT
jgi:hypothetical protein